jgi:hypothetical protein
MNTTTILQHLLLFLQLLHVASFIASQCNRASYHRLSRRLANPTDSELDQRGSSYESSASIIKGVVSSLTSITNVFSLLKDAETKLPEQATTTATALNPPITSAELLERIRDDYTKNNYLWTGKLDTSSFTSNCKFTDPTISFEGIDKYITNVGNLVPVVEFLLGEEQYSKSELLEITSNAEKGYIETRWNMIGELNALPWRPKIDVIGRTKFWYQNADKGGKARVQVYFYDEQWEIPAGLALLQFITPANTISNSNAK